MRHTTIDRSNLMDLSMTTMKGFSIVEIKFQTITFSYSLSYIKLKLSIYSFVHLTNQLTLVGFILLSVFIRT